MESKHIVVGAIAAGLSVAVMTFPLHGQQASPAGPYNTVKTKLANGQQVFGGTVSIPDPDVYCAVANAGFDFTWIEMQHSPLSFPDVDVVFVASTDLTSFSGLPQGNPRYEAMVTRARVGLGLTPTGCPSGPIAETEGTEPRG